MSDPVELLARAIAGDEAAWRQLVDRYHALVFHVIRSHRIAEHEGEDLFQEVFLRLYRHAHRIQDAVALTRWVAVTTRNLCLDHVARRGREAGRPEAAQEADGTPGPSAELERAEAAQHVREALTQISERCQELLRTLYFELDEPDYRRAAERLGMPVGSVGPTRQRCLARLLAALRRRDLSYSDHPVRGPLTRTGR